MTKRTLGGTKKKVVKVSGFRNRMKTKKGQKVISRRRNKGRKFLAKH